MMAESAFKPAWWLRNAHAQTIFPTVTRQLQPPIDYNERFELPDGDFIDLAWAVNGLPQDAPLVVVLHGMGGDVHSHYVAGFLHAFNRWGWRGMLMHFRGASPEPNRLPRAYHSGDTEDVDCLLRVLAAREPTTKKAIVGVSLGGNVLLKWLGERGAQSLVQAAAAVSVPFQIHIVADRINQGFARIYQAYFLRMLRQVYARKLVQQSDSLPPAIKSMESFRCIWTFDDNVTAPLHGFAHVHDYYRKASSRQYLNSIKTPTLIIHALDDPFMTPAILPESRELSKDIIFELSQKGGHAGFVGGPIPGMPIYWLDHRIPQFLQDYL